MDTVATMPRCLLQHRAVLLWSMSIVCSFVSKSLQTIWSYVAEQQSLSKTEEKQRRQGCLLVNVGQEVYPGSECTQPPRKSCWREDTGGKYQEHSPIRNSFSASWEKDNSQSESLCNQLAAISLSVTDWIFSVTFNNKLSGSAQNLVWTWCKYSIQHMHMWLPLVEQLHTLALTQYDHKFLWTYMKEYMLCG